MTDPIRIPIDGSHGAQDAWQHTLTITPDLARRIVELGAAAMPLQMDKDGMVRPIMGWSMPATATPVAGDEAAVKALMDIKLNATDYACNGWGSPFGASASAIIAAIKAGKVPGICCDNDPNALSRRIAQECADALGKLKQVRADLAAETDAKNRALTCAANYAEEVEELKADLAACRAELTETKTLLDDWSKVGDDMQTAYRDATRMHNTRPFPELITHLVSLADDQFIKYTTEANKSATLTAQRDRLAALLLRVYNEWQEDDNGSPTFGCMDEIKAALPNPPTPTAPTPGAGDAK